MAITVLDTVPVSLRTTGTATLTVTGYTVPAGTANRLTVVFYHVHNGSSITATLNGQAMTMSSLFAGSASADGFGVGYKTSPQSGDLVVTENTSSAIDGYVLTLDGVDQTTPFDTGVKDFISSTSITISITTANANEMLLTFYGANQSISSFNGSETNVMNNAAGQFSGSERASYKIAASAGSNSMGYTAASSGSLQGAIAAFIASAAAATVASPNRRMRTGIGS